MALKFDDYLFYHIPKTGGGYVRQVLYVVAKEFKEIGHTHNTPLEIENYEKIPSFTIVRHPLAWYKSYYRYRVKKNWRKGHFIDKHVKADNFEDFMKNMLYAYPCGYVTSRYLSVVPFISNILRTETLTEDLRQLLAKWGYKFPLTKTWPERKEKIGDRKINTSISPETMSKLLKAESRIISHLGY